MTEGSPAKGSLVGVYTNLSMTRHIQHPYEGSGKKCAKRVSRTFLSASSFPGLFAHFVIVWGIRTTKLTCRIKDFQWVCDSCHHYVLLLDSKYGST